MPSGCEEDHLLGGELVVVLAHELLYPVANVREQTSRFVHLVRVDRADVGKLMNRGCR